MKIRNSMDYKLKILSAVVFVMIEANQDSLRTCQIMSSKELKRAFHRKNTVFPMIPKTTSSRYQRMCRAPFYVTSTALSDISSCPWYYDVDNDSNRFPENITIAKRKCCNTNDCAHTNRPQYCLDLTQGNRLQNNHNGICEPISIDIIVFKKHICNQTLCCYEEEPFSVDVGFTCRFRPVRNS